MPWVMLGLRMAPIEDSAVSSAKMVNGCPLVLLGQFLKVKKMPAQSFVKKTQQLVNTSRSLVYST
jgi:hypothetical protein